MKSLQDALYNWLTIKVVFDARPDDKAAAETEEMFREMLVEDYGLENIQTAINGEMYEIVYVQNGEGGKKQFPRELIDVMLDQINLEPEKYVNYD